MPASVYTNHRPAFGLQTEKLMWAFDVLGDKDDVNEAPNVFRGELLDLLQNRGARSQSRHVSQCMNAA